MRKALAAAAGLVAIVAIGIPGASAAGKKGSFTQTFVGAQISGGNTEGVDAYAVTDSVNGHGAAVQKTKVTGTTFPLNGTDTATAWFANGSVKTSDTFTVSAPDGNGISTITGSGKCVSGTGVHKAKTCKYTFKGTYDTKTTRVIVKVKGTYAR